MKAMLAILQAQQMLLIQLILEDLTAWKTRPRIRLVQTGLVMLANQMYNMTHVSETR